MNYTREDIESLVRDLKGYEDLYQILVDFFENHLDKGHLDFGLSEPGSSGSALVISELGLLFPDVLYALRMGTEELLTFIMDGVGEEQPIAVWRIRNDTGFCPDGNN